MESKAAVVIIVKIVHVLRKIHAYVVLARMRSYLWNTTLLVCILQIFKGYIYHGKCIFD